MAGAIILYGMLTTAIIVAIGVASARMEDK